MTDISSARLDLASLIRPGDTVLLAQGGSLPLTLASLLVEQADRIGPINVFLGSTFAPIFDPAKTPHFNFIGFGGIGQGAALLAKAGRMGVVTSTLGTLPGLFASGTIKADVVLMQTSPPVDGVSSVGLCNDYTIDAARQARTVVAEVNEQMPWIAGAECPADIRIDASIALSTPPVELRSAATDAVSESIARLVAGLIPDGATIQTGIGAIPDAIATALLHHKRLGIHSGMIGDRMIELIRRGVVTNESKPIDTGISITNSVLGTELSYRFVDKNPAVKMFHTTYTHAITTLAKIPDLIAINSAIEVDLTGQVNAEVANGSYVGGVGGQPDFVRGAFASRAGKSVMALPSTAKGGALSRVVSDLSGGIVTTPRCDADIVVTEWGVAELRGKTLAERAKQMIAIAAPQFREELERVARQRFGSL